MQNCTLFVQLEMLLIIKQLARGLLVLFTLYPKALSKEKSDCHSKTLNNTKWVSLQTPPS